MVGDGEPTSPCGRDRRPRTWWWRNLSLRARLTITATTVLAVGLAVAGVALVAALTHSLTGALDTSARRTAAQVAALRESGDALPNPLPVGDGNTVLVQVVNAKRQVLASAATQSEDRLVPLLSDSQLARVRRGAVLTLPGDAVAVNGPVRVLGRETGLGNDAETVLVAVYAKQVGQSARAVRNGLAIGAPVLLVLGAALSWYVVGRALRPVEALRAGAAEITGSGALGGQALPVPAGNDEIHRLGETLNDMLARLDAASAKQRGFVADAAHELRSPLASLRTQLEVAQRLGTRADWAETSTGALVDIDRLSRLVDDLLLLARLDDAGVRVRRDDVDLSVIVRRVVDGYSAHVRAPIRFAVDDDGHPPLVNADRDALARVVRNLVDNAVRHAVDDVRVSVTRGAGGLDVVLVVADDGPGIPAADRERVFDRFARLDEARARDAGGTGLGLPIVRELVRSHGGSVTLADARAGPDDGGGSAAGLRVEIRLPGVT